MLLEPVADALLSDHPLLDAAADAAVLAGREGLGCEVVDAGVEAVLDETAVGLCSLNMLARGPRFRGLVDASSGVRMSEGI